MVVLVTGGTGFVGCRLIARLRADQHEVRVLTRSPERARRILKGCELIAWPDVATPPPAAGLAGVQAVIHLAGEKVAGLWTRAKRERIRDSRIDSTRALVTALAQLEPRPQVLVSASAIGYYGDRGDELLAEDSHPTQDFLSELCQEWEREARRAEEHGIGVAIPRIGIVVGQGGGALAAMELPFKLGAGGPLGSGQQWWSWIDVEDLVSLLLLAAEGEMRGIFNAVAPHPVRQREFAKAFGEQLRRPAFLPAPAPLLRAVVGGFSWELLSSKKVDARKVIDAGYGFRSPRLEDALERIYS